MEKDLRRKFILISTSVVFFVLVILTTVVNVINYLEVDDMVNQIISIMADNNGNFPQNFDNNARPNQQNQPIPGFTNSSHISAETPYTTRYFTVLVDDDYQLINADMRSIQLVNTEIAIEYAEDALNSGKDSGFFDRYKFQLVDVDDGTLLIFVDCNEELSVFYSFLQSSVLISIVTVILVFVLMIFLSKHAVSPIVESYYKQQQFITNITHELKTPLAIIKTNTEVIEMENSESNWTQSIHKQVNRLNQLISYLVSLSSQEEANTKPKLDFSISDAMEEVLSSFDVLAKNKNSTIHADIEKNLTYHGDEQSLRLLISILMDNATKYNKEGTDIFISLKKHRDKIKIQTKNYANDLEKGNYNALFQRFYRLEGSRNSKLGGFGIGLAMAKAIVENHGGSIKAESVDGESIEFKAKI